MHTKPLVRWLAIGCLAALVMAGMPAGRAESSHAANPPVVSLGDDTYSLTRRANFLYFRNTAKLAKRARADAEKYCHDLGREMKELSMDEQKDALVIGDFSRATIKFKALAPGDPALTESRAATPALPAGGGDLAKLEELHRSGILADPEFDAAKKRLAERSLQELHAKGVLTDGEFEAARKRLGER